MIRSSFRHMQALDHANDEYLPVIRQKTPKTVITTVQNARILWEDGDSDTLDLLSSSQDPFPAPTTNTLSPPPTPPFHPEESRLAHPLSQDDPPLVLNPHPVHFYEDGNLLIELNGVHFKLFWTLMAKSSTFFQEYYNIWKIDAEKIDLLTGKEEMSLDTVNVTVEDFSILLDLMYLPNPYQLGNNHGLETAIPILFASHNLSFERYFEWAKERLVSLWCIGNDFLNLSVITNHSIKDARDSLILAQTCHISEVTKPALYSVLHLSSFGFEDTEQLEYERTMGIHSLSCREHLSNHWTATLGRLRLISCVNQLQDEEDMVLTAERPPCASNDAAKSDLIYYRILFKDGFYQEYINDPLVGLYTLRSQLQTAANSFRKKRKRSSEQTVQFNPWADGQDGDRLCKDCLLRMSVICSEAMEQCWERLEEWALGIREEEDDDIEVG